MRKQFIIAMVTIFVLLKALFYSMKTYAPAFRFPALETGNTIMAMLSVGTYLLVEKQLDGRPQAFVRSVYSASFLKLMVCMFSILVYVLLNRTNIHKPSVYVLFGIYAIYTIIETWLLSKLVRDKQ
jgi:hypothetical protein